MSDRQATGEFPCSLTLVSDLSYVPILCSQLAYCSSEKQAVQYYTLAANLGDPDAQQGVLLFRPVLCQTFLSFMGREMLGVLHLTQWFTNRDWLLLRNWKGSQEVHEASCQVLSDGVCARSSNDGISVDLERKGSSNIFSSSDNHFPTAY